MIRPAGLFRRIFAAGGPAFFRALVALPVLAFVTLALGGLGYPRVQRLLVATSPMPRRSASSHFDEALQRRGQAWARAVARVARNLPGRPTCLPRALTLWWLLRWHRRSVSLRIGVRRPDDKESAIPTVDAHAWVEMEGQPVGERPDISQRYAPFDGSVAEAFETR